MLKPKGLKAQPMVLQLSVCFATFASSAHATAREQTNHTHDTAFTHVEGKSSPAGSHSTPTPLRSLLQYASRYYCGLVVLCFMLVHYSSLGTPARGIHNSPPMCPAVNYGEARGQRIPEDFLLVSSETCKLERRPEFTICRLQIKRPSACGTSSVKQDVKENCENQIRKLTHICSNLLSNVPG